MDHVVHINGGDDGSRAAKPIVLRLMPGEETGFNLKVVNHGEPSNISLQASGPISKAVRLRKPDRYVVMEEVVPVMARMPAGERQLDGAILLSSPAGQSRVPITLFADPEDSEFDEADAVEEAAWDEEGEGEQADDDGDEEDWEGAPRKRRGGAEDEDDEGSESQRITFSKDRDLQRYRSASRRKTASNGTKAGDPSLRERRDCSAGRADDVPDDRAISSTPQRFITSIDDSFVDKSAGDLPPRQREPDEPKYGGFLQDGDRESRERFESVEREKLAAGFQDLPGHDGDFGQNRSEGERTQDSHNEIAGADEYEDEGEGALVERLESFSLESLQIIPAAIFLALVAILILTFIMEAVPEFAGALASSILIVTLIIYGAATLLKA